MVTIKKIKRNHAALHAGSHGWVLYYASTEHALQHDLKKKKNLMVTIVEVHKLILDVCVSLITTVDENFLWTIC